MPVRTIVIIAAVAAALVCSPAAAKNNKVDVCHVEGNGGYHIINVNENAVDAHLGHGDWLVTEEVCGDGIDNDCDGDVDEDCCPCYGREDLDAYWPANAPTYAFCFDNTYDNGNYMHDDLWAWGYEYADHDYQGYMSVYAEQWGYSGPENYYCYFYGRMRDLQTDEVDEELYSMYTTAEEYAACDATLAGFIEDSGLECEETHDP
jgi:hypothetical protein